MNQTRTRTRVVLAGIALLSAFLVYRAWDSPERRIRRILDEVAEALSHDEPVSGLAAVTPATSLRPHLAPEITIDAGRRAGVVTGASDVVASAARLRLATSMLRLEFLDVQVSLTDDTAATVHATVKITTRGRDGNQVVDASEILGSFALREGQWVVTAIRTVSVLEPVL